MLRKHVSRTAYPLLLIHIGVRLSLLLLNNMPTEFGFFFFHEIHSARVIESPPARGSGSHTMRTTHQSSRDACGLMTEEAEARRGRQAGGVVDLEELRSTCSKAA